MKNKKNLLLESKQNQYTMKSESKNHNLGMGVSTAGSGPSVSVGGGESRARRDRKWTDQVASIVGTELVNIDVAGNTHIKGAMIANINDNGEDGGNLTLTTNTLSYEDINDYDNSKGSGYQLGFSNSTSGGLSGSTTIGGHSSGSKKEGITRATIGNGTILVADVGVQVSSAAPFFFKSFLSKKISMIL